MLLYKRKFTYSLGVIIAHLGVGLLILGITASSIWQIEKIATMKINSEVQINNYKIKFNQIKEVKGPNYLALQGNFIISDNKNNIITTLKPQNRFYPIARHFYYRTLYTRNFIKRFIYCFG